MIAHSQATADPDRIRLLQFLAIFAIGGTERHFMNLTAGLDRTRFDLHVGCLKRLGEFLPEISERRIPVSDYKIKRLYGPHTLRQQLRFASYLRRNRVDIVCSYNFHANCFAIPAAWLARTPVVVASIRDIGAFLTPRQRLVQRMVCRLATVVLVNAEAVRQWLIGEGYDASKIVVIRNGIDLARFDRPRAGAGVRQELGVSRDAPVIGMLARVTRLKGVEYFLEAAAAVAPRFPDARFLLVGDVPSDAGYRSELKDRIRQLALEGRVVFTGFRLDVPELLDEVTVSVLPSLSEGLSNAVLESMAAGVPVVATRVGGMAEAIEDGVTGLLVPPRDSRALAHAIARILEDRELATRLGQAGRRRVVEHFSLARMVRETDRLCSTLLAQAREGKGSPPAARPRLVRTSLDASAPR
jgi:glycosyltransferase involved in cell wall biosynthesis